MGEGWLGELVPGHPSRSVIDAKRLCQAETCSAGAMFTTRRPRRVPNSTVPGTSANSVSSPPRPTPSPGWKWVPRCRTMISPALTSWPPNRFTPRRWALESRPLRVEDAPFLCAISATSALDAGDLDPGVPLPMALALAVPGLVLELQDADLRTLGLVQHLGGHLGRLEGGLVRRDRFPVDQEDGLQLHAGAGLVADPVDLDDVANGHLVLAAATAHDRVHA